MLGMQDGIETTITAGRSGWMSHPSHGIHQIHLVGTEGSMTIDAYRPRLEVYSDTEPWRQPQTPHPEDPMGFWSSTQKESGITQKTDWQSVQPVLQSDTEFFLDCIEEDCQSDVPASVGAHAVQAIMAGYESAATGTTVRLSSFID